MKQEKIRLLEQRILQTEDSLEKAKLLNELALVLEDSNLSHGIRAIDEAVQITQKLTDSDPEVATVIANSLFTRGLLNLEITNYEFAISSIYQALPLITRFKDDLLTGRAFEVLAKANFILGNTPEGFEFCWQALGFYENLSNRRWQSGLYNLVGREYLEMGQFEWAERYFQLAFDQLKKMETNKSHADIHLNLSLLRSRSGEFDQAVQHANTAIQIFEINNANDKLINALITLARIFEDQKEFDQGVQCLQKALSICEKNGMYYRQVQVLLAYGQNLLEQKIYDASFERLNQALALSERLNMRREGYKIHRSLARGYKQVGSFDRSLEHFENFYRLEKQNEKDQDVQRIRSLEILRQVEPIRKSLKPFSDQSRGLREQLDQMRQSQISQNPLVISDPLTGLLNRNHFLTILENDHLNIEHYGSKVAMIMLDVDQFKKVNQTYGNLIADQILVGLASLIRAEFPLPDLVWRISGEEFVILLPNTDFQQAQVLAEELLQQVREHIFEIENLKINITITMGIACTSANIEKRVDTLLQQASQAWTKAKQAGGNQVVI